MVFMTSTIGPAKTNVGKSSNSNSLIKNNIYDSNTFKDHLRFFLNESLIYKLILKKTITISFRRTDEGYTGPVRSKFKPVEINGNAEIDFFDKSNSIFKEGSKL